MIMAHGGTGAASAVRTRSRAARFREVRGFDRT
jgi:hypothetical protein